jgi:hypothetical protein
MRKRTNQDPVAKNDREADANGYRGSDDLEASWVGENSVVAGLKNATQSKYRPSS